MTQADFITLIIYILGCVVTGQVIDMICLKVFKDPNRYELASVLGSSIGILAWATFWLKQYL